MKFAKYINENTDDKAFTKLLISKLYQVNSSGEIQFNGNEFNRSYSSPISIIIDNNPKYGYLFGKSANIYRLALSNHPKLKSMIMNITSEQMDILYFAVLEYGITIMDKQGEDKGTFEVDRKF